MAIVAYTDPTIDTNSRYRIRQGNRQKPFVAPIELAYTVYDVTATNRVSIGGGSINFKAGLNTTGCRLGEIYYAVCSVWGSSDIPNWANTVYSRLYNKLLGKVSERASLLTALAEYRSTSVMVGNRLLQVYKGMRALRKGRFREFLRLFSVQALPRHKHTRWTKPRDASSLWLEYWFGWAPTIGDIGNAIDVLQGEIPGEGVRVSSGMSSTSLSSSKWSGKRPYYSHQINGFFVMQLRCNLRVTNHNLWLANQLGFVNPVRTAWELVPFSWFADWFTNIGQVLGSFTDTVGIEVSDVWITRFASGVTDEFQMQSSTQGWRRNRAYFAVKREYRRKLPRPELILRVPGLSWTRGATLSALIVQLFAPPRTSRA